MKISRINFSPFKEEPATNSIQISWIEREENYIALNDRLYFPKLPKQNGRTIWFSIPSIAHNVQSVPQD